MGQRDNQLPVPPAAARDSQSREMIRAWIAENGLHCVMNIGTWPERGPRDEAQAWGILLADVARHIANAFEEHSGADPRELVESIRDRFNAEIDQPTSPHRGGFTQ